MDPLSPGHIRLLRIEAGEGDAPIRCQLLTTPLQSAPPYEALSYTWGSQARDHAIDCDGRPTQVTTNLHDALRQLRKPAEERVMWIDMLCIEQSDPTEQSEQVGMMKHIFSQAARVIVWLGSSDEGDVDLAFGLLERFAKLFEAHGWWQLGVEDLRGLPDLFDPPWAALAHLFMRPYFSRIWIAQEIAMAKDITVVCGAFSCEWSLLSDMANFLRRASRVGPYSLTHVRGVPAVFLMNLIKDAHVSQNASWSLFPLLRLTRRYEATDVRDKVFAVMGIVVGGGADLGVTVDYQLTAEEVFTQVATHYLETLQDVEILANAGMSQNLPVPTWVPDWSFGDGRMIIAGAGNASKMTAAGESLPELSISRDRTLTIRGALIGSIARISTDYLPDAFDGSNAAKLRETMRKGKIALLSAVDFAEAASTFPPGQTREQALWRTLCCNFTAGVPVQRAPAEWAVAWKIALRQYRMVSDDGAIDRVRLQEDLDRDFQEDDVRHFADLSGSLNGHSKSRTLAITSDGRLAYVPRLGEVGDHVCIIFGSRVPFLVRELASGRFRLVGEAYVHGIMDGEAMAGIDSLVQDLEIE